LSAARTTPSKRTMSLVHAKVGRLCCKPHTSVPLTCCGVALRRHGPGVHSPIRQLSNSHHDCLWETGQEEEERREKVGGEKKSHLIRREKRMWLLKFRVHLLVTELH
jgi:hypothetical protein